MRTLRLPVLFAGAVLSFPLLVAAAESTIAAAGLTLHDAVARAWQRSVLVKTQEARQGEAAAGQTVAQSWLAAAPTLGLSERSDRWTDHRNQRETEISIAAPILLPNQLSARRQFAARSADEVAAQLHRARLEVAGAVRLRLWEAAAASELLAEKEAHLHHLDELKDAVDRRVAAGDLARSDGLLAAQEVFAAQGDVAVARSRAREALNRFRLLTGLAELPSMTFEVLSSEQPVHGRLRAAEAAEHRARAAVTLAAAGVMGPPTVSLSMRRERENALSGANRSIGIAVHIPLGGKIRNRPAETLAATQLATAAGELSEARAALDLDVEQARAQLRDATDALEAALERVTVMRQHTTLFEKAFKQGERGLAELLRSQTLTHEAEVAVRQQEIALGLAHAQLNQALGILP
jgi:cobalt-zinc-cadmium efflux system outer membrane protein